MPTVRRLSDNAELLTFIDQLRGKGIRVFKGPFGEGVVELELGPALVPDGPVGPEAKDPSVCACGCPVYAHTQGLCLAGCEADKCAPEAS